MLAGGSPHNIVNRKVGTHTVHENVTGVSFSCLIISNLMDLWYISFIFLIIHVITENLKQLFAPEFAKAVTLTGLHASHKTTYSTPDS